MNFQNLYRVNYSLLPYKIALILAVAILFLIAGQSYGKIKNLQKASEWVAHSLEVDKEIYGLFSYYNEMESACLRSRIINDSSYLVSYENYKAGSEHSFQKLAFLTRDITEHRIYLDSISRLKNSLILTLDAINSQPVTIDTFNPDTRQKMQKVTDIQNQLAKYKSAMLIKKDALLQERMATYISQSTLSTINSLLLALFSLFVFGIAFYKISRHKKRIFYSESFLFNILQSTDNIINYYEPIYRDDKIVDFKIVFANQGNKVYLNVSPAAITGKPVSKVFPYHLQNGELNLMISAFTEKKIVSFDHQIMIEAEKMWFRFIVSPMEQGITVTIINTSPERNEEENLRVLNEMLRTHNQELEETKSFLKAILSSTNNIIISFEPVWNEDAEIIDFKYVYLNEQVEPVINSSPEEIIGRMVSEVSPGVFKSGVFEKLVSCYTRNMPIDYETNYERDGKKYWFHGKAIRSGNRITITSTDISNLKNALQDLIILNDDLEIQNSILSEAEAMAQIGSYTFFLDTATSVISNNFYRLLGIEPHEFDPSFETFRKFVHPDDHEFYEKIVKQILEGRQTGVYNYRIITKDGKVKNLKSKGDFRKRDGKTILVGVVQDVTDQMKSERILRYRNLELKRTNAELESFNRVASHDLQEPLRKIQMFLSRISEDDRKMLSDRVVHNLDKVNHTAIRMQSLIINLLTYSRIDNRHENFEEVNINIVLEKVLEDLAVPIQDARVVISFEELPTVKGVAYQLEQVFSNLISNAIKYRSKTKTPEIAIHAEKVHRSQIAESFEKPALHYYKITTVDNGIGFDPEYAIKIFELFERLHQKTEYSGTGIGLAICKKIIENHHGYIYAESHEDKGAAFMIYLPA